MKREWEDFCVTIAMRFIGGMMLGALAAVVIGYRIILRRLARNEVSWVGFWIGAWAFGGGIVAVLRTPHWQTPWYKGLTTSTPQQLPVHAPTDTATDLYGFESGDLDEARVAVESALGCELEARYSDYLGEYYRGALPSGVSLRLRRNEDPVPKEQIDPPPERYAEPEFAPFPILLYVSGSALYDVRRKVESVAGVCFLQRRPCTSAPEV